MHLWYNINILGSTTMGEKKVKNQDTFLNLGEQLTLSELVFQHIEVAVFILNDEGIILTCNQPSESITGFQSEELVGSHFSVLFKQETEFLKIWSKLNLSSKWMGEVHTVKKSGNRFIAKLKLQKVLQSDSTRYFLAILEDITHQKKSENELLLAEKIFENISEGVLITDKKGRIISVNPAFQIVTGYTEEEVVGKNPNILQSGLHNQEFYNEMWSEITNKGRWKGEIWNKRKNGEVFPEWLTISSIYDELGNITNYVAVFSDITDRKQAEEQLRKLAHYDVLTGTANRYLLNKSLERLLVTAKKYNQMVAVLFLDLDRFKQVNDTLGHNYGDLLLKKVSARLKGLLKNKDIIARQGGDEFVIVLPNIKHAKEAVAVSKDIINSLKNSFQLHDQEVYISTSIGISLYPYDGDDVYTLLKNADRAMYQAKSNGKNSFEFYHTGLHHENETRHMKLENCLRKALDRHELSLHYHPQVDTRTGQITGVEALLRWNQEEFGAISPAEFIPIAEETGLIIPISEWVIRQACEDAKRLHLLGFHPLRVSVNISGLHFNQDDFVKNVSSIVQNTNVNPHCLELELTESMIMPNASEAINKLVKLKQLGIKLSIDDFGTGYSSLSYLHRFPIDILKIDQSFIKKLNIYKEDASIVRAIITMAHRLNLDVVAEGVEGKKQYKFLKDEGCNYVQGYYITKPLPLNELIDFLELWDKDLLE